MSTEKDEYVIDTAAAVDALKKLIEATKQGTHETEEAHKAVHGFGDFLAHDLTHHIATAQAQYELMKEVLHEVVEVVKESVELSMKQQVAMARLGVALEANGVKSESFKEALERQASSLEHLTGASEEQVNAVQTMLLTMHTAPENLERVTAAAFKLSQMMGVDATTAARQLGRANAEGKDELKRYGIVFDETAGEAKNFESVLNQIEKRSGDINEKLPAEIRGWNDLKASIEDLKKAFGGLTLEALSGTSHLLGAKDSAELLGSVARYIRHPIDVLTGSFEAQDKEIEKIIEHEEELAEMRKKNAGAAPHLTLDTLDVGPARAKLQQEAAAQQKKYAEEMLSATKQVGGEEMRYFVDQYKDKEKLDEAWASRKQSEMAASDKAAAESAKYQEDAYASYVRACIQWDAEHKTAWEAAWQEASQEFVGYMKQLAGAYISYFANMLTQNTKFNRAMEGLHREEELRGLNEEERKKKLMELDAKAKEASIANFMATTAEVLKQIGMQAAIKALNEGAEAVAAAARYDYDSAGEHAASAALYAGVAVAAGVGAAVLSGARGMTDSEQSQYDAALKDQKDRRDREDKQDAQSKKGMADTIVNVYQIGITGYTEREQGAELERVRTQYTKLKTGSN